MLAPAGKEERPADKQRKWKVAVGAVVMKFGQLSESKFKKNCQMDQPGDFFGSKCRRWSGTPAHVEQADTMARTASVRVGAHERR